MKFIATNETFVPPNTAKKLYPVAQGMVISLFLMVVLLGSTGMIPDLITHRPIALASKELPLRIIIPKLGIDSVVINPMASDVASLDQALLSGVVRHPGSGTMGSPGNIVLFGHSSHLRFVNNKAYQSFNDIHTLKTGDEIMLYSDTSSLTYKVTRVYEVKNTEGGVDGRATTEKLTLITCNNFGAKEDRYIVEAQLIK